MNKKDEKLVSIKVYESTRKALKIIGAKNTENQFDIIDRLVAPELIRVEKKRTHAHS
jgi:hypothetical protein